MNFTLFFAKEKGGGAYDLIEVPSRTNKKQEVSRLVKKFLVKAKAVLEHQGGEGYVDTAITMIIAVVIGGLLLGGLYYIFNGMILPGLAERIQSMFS